MNHSRGPRYGRRDGGGHGRNRDRSRSPYRQPPPPPPRRRSRSPSPRRRGYHAVPPPPPPPRRDDDMYRFDGKRHDDNRTNFTFRMPARRPPSPPRRHSPPRNFARDRDRDRGYDREPDERDFGYGPGSGVDRYRGTGAGDHYGRSSPRRGGFEDRRGQAPPRGPRHWNPNTREAIKDRYQQYKFKKPIAAHDRPILHAKRESTPEQLAGMQKSGYEFTLGDENEADEENGAEAEEDGSGSDVPMEIEEEESKSKEIVKEGDAEELEKADKIKKDVIALIRKAKKAAPVAEQHNAVAANDDFIPLDFGFDDDKKEEITEIEEEDSEDGLSEDEDEERRKFRKKSDAQAPDGDSTPQFAIPNGANFSHRDVLHSVLDKLQPKDTGPPGASGAITAVNGPPPGLGASKKRKNVFGDDESDSEEIVTVVTPPNPRKRKLADRGLKLNMSMQGHFRFEYRITDPSINPTPWLREDLDHSQTLHMNTWLHKEIIDYVEFLGPTDIDKAVRQHVIYRVQKAILPVFRDADIRCFGSFASNLFLPGSDLDLVLLSRDFLKRGIPRYNQARDLYDTANLLRRHVARHGSVVVVAKARVPIIKFVDDLTGLHVDISFENTSGLRAIATLKDWRTTHPALPFLTTLLKQYLLMRNMHEVYEGGIGGFSIICMIVAFLRLHPAFAAGTLDPRLNLGVAFMEFLDLYGNRINTYEVGIDPAAGKYFTKPMVPLSQQTKHFRPYLLSILDPNDKTNDLSKASYQVLEIFTCFRESLEILKKEMERIEALPLPERKGESLLRCIFGGNYTETIKLRKRMNELFQAHVPDNFLPVGEEREGLLPSLKNGVVTAPPPPPPPPPPPSPPPPPPVVEKKLPTATNGTSAAGIPATPARNQLKNGKKDTVKEEAEESDDESVSMESSSSSESESESEDELVEVTGDDWDQSRKKVKLSE